MEVCYASFYMFYSGINTINRVENYSIGGLYIGTLYVHKKYKENKDEVSNSRSIINFVFFYVGWSAKRTR